MYADRDTSCGGKFFFCVLTKKIYNRATIRENIWDCIGWRAPAANSFMYFI